MTELSKTTLHVELRPDIEEGLKAAGEEHAERARAVLTAERRRRMEYTG